MKVIHVLRKYDRRQWGGTESLLLTQIRELQKQGIENFILAPRYRDPIDDQSDECPFYKNNIKILRYRAYLPKVFISDEIRKKEIEIGGNIISFELFRMIRRLNPDVIHCHTLNRIAAICIYCAKKLGKPCLLTIHGGLYNITSQLKSSLVSKQAKGFDLGKIFGFIFKSRGLLKRASKVIVINKKEKELIEEKDEIKNVVLLPNCVDVESFEEEGKNPFDDQSFNVSVVGRIDPSKNQLWLLNNFENVLRVAPNIHVTFVGPPTNEEYAKEFETKLGEFPSNTSYRGQLSPKSKELKSIFRYSDLVLVPSLSEPFGIITLEAWLEKSAVMASNVGGLVDLITHGETGYLFELNNMNDFCSKLSQIYNNREKLSKLGEGGYKHLLEHYSTERVCEKLIGLYRELMDNLDVR